MLTKRDPRLDPMWGDVVLQRRTVRTVCALFVSGRVEWATESPINSGIITLNAWRRWAKNAEVLHAAE